MRLRHQDGSTVYLGYCTNVHPAEDVDAVLDQLATYAEPLRSRLGTDTLGVGLWLSHTVAKALNDDPAAQRRFRAELRARGLEVVTLNGFPYGGFHAPVVKHRVYTPDWSDPARLDYTLTLARLLTMLLPEDVSEGSISTLPLGWRADWCPDRAEAARYHLDALAHGLAKIAAATGRRIRVGFEPEPGCVLGRTSDLAEHLDGVDPAWLGVCLDACHLAVEFEDPATAVAHVRAAGLDVVKLQASCALEAPATPEALAALRSYVEPKFLHQTRMVRSGTVHGTDDLAEAFHRLHKDRPWRTHFHLPAHAQPPAPLRGTLDQLTDTFDALLGGPVALTQQVEIEVYTWSVLPGMRSRESGDDLVSGLAEELRWTRDRLCQLGLHEVIG